MRFSKQILTWVGLLLLSGSSMSCIDQEASLGMQGIVAFSGTQSTTEVQCGEASGEMEPPTYDRTLLSCNDDVTPGDVENFRTRLELNISDFANAGQLGENKAGFGTDAFCEAAENDMLEQFRRQELYYNSFNHYVSVVNRLQDSRTVESGSQGGGGGGGGGFENLFLDVNDINIQQFQIRYPGVSESSQLGLDRDQRIGIIVESDGGAAILEMSLFNNSGSTITALETLHRNLVLRRLGYDQYTQEARGESVTIVAEVTLLGETIGTQEVESNSLEIPISICNASGACATTSRCDFASQQGG
jgi:hypothetical protein